MNTWTCSNERFLFTWTFIWTLMNVFIWAFINNIMNSDHEHNSTNADEHEGFPSTNIVHELFIWTNLKWTSRAWTRTISVCERFIWTSEMNDSSCEQLPFVNGSFEHLKWTILVGNNCRLWTVRLNIWNQRLFWWQTISVCERSLILNMSFEMNDFGCRKQTISVYERFIWIMVGCRTTNRFLIDSWQDRFEK